MIKLTDLGTSGDPRSWFLAWVGSVDNSISGHTPKVNALLYPLYDDVHGENFKAKKDQIVVKDYRVRQLDVGLMPLFSMGSIIENDSVVAEPQEYLDRYKIKLLSGIIDKKNIVPIGKFFSGITKKKDEAQNEKSYSNYDFPLIIFGDSNVICLVNGESQESEFDIVLIPCMELIRFYFCTSDNLSQELFTGGLHASSNRIFNPDKLTSKAELELGHVPKIYLRKRMIYSDAMVVGRIAYSSEAMHSAKSIYNSIQQGSFNNKKINPISYFPFSSSSDLVVTGQEITAVGNANEFVGKKILLVYNLLECNGTFPFQTIIRYKEQSGDQGKNKDDPNLNKSGWPGGTNHNNNEEDNHDNIEEEEEKDKDIDINSKGPRNHNPQRILITKFEERFKHAPTIIKGEKFLQETKKGEGFLPPPPDADNFTVTTESGDSPSTGEADINIDAPKNQNSKTDEYNERQKENNKEDEDTDSEGHDNVERQDQKIHSREEYENHFNGLVKKLADTRKFVIERITDKDMAYIKFNPNCFDKDSPSYKWATGGYFYNGERKEWQGERDAIVIRVTEIETNHAFFMFDWLKTDNEWNQPGGKILCICNKELLEEKLMTFIKEIIETCASNKRTWLKPAQFRECERITVNHYIENGLSTTYQSLRKSLIKLNFNLPDEVSN